MLDTIRAAIEKLPVQFIMLAIMMSVMVYALGGLMEREARHREAIFKPIIDGCMHVLEAR